jgi:hypothetical protein
LPIQKNTTDLDQLSLWSEWSDQIERETSTKTIT